MRTAVFMTLFFIVIFGGTAIAAYRQTSRRPRLPPEAINLDSIRNALMEKRGWSRDRAEAARAEYVRFLTLLQMKPGFMLVPWSTPEGHDDLDQFWHQHILDTAKYANDCNLLFGHMIHHTPHVVRGSEQESESVTKTQRLYARTFNSGKYGTSADPAFLSGCSACGTIDTDSGHGHGGHGSSDGGHGSSHSCGGHSCGGHGCGHGCGGH